MGIKIKAKQTSNIEVTASLQDIVEAMCNIIYKAHNLPKGCWADTYGKLWVENDSRIGSEYVRMSSHKDIVALEIIKHIKEYG